MYVLAVHWAYSVFGTAELVGSVPAALTILPAVYEVPVPSALVVHLANVQPVTASGVAAVVDADVIISAGAGAVP